MNARKAACLLPLVSVSFLRAGKIKNKMGIKPRLLFITHDNVKVYSILCFYNGLAKN